MGSMYKLTDVGVGAAITEDTTQTLTERPVGAHSSATILVDVTTITGTWTITARLNIGGDTIDVATLASITTTGVKVITLAAAFALDEAAVPEINEMFYDETVAGSLIAQVYVCYAG